MGMKHKTYLQSPYVYGCAKCKTHLTSLDALISKEFNGQMGRAFLFDNVVNVDLGEADDRHMRTGKHTDRAFVSAEKYKEGKYILETSLLDDVQ